MASEVLLKTDQIPKRFSTDLVSMVEILSTSTRNNECSGRNGIATVVLVVRTNVVKSGSQEVKGRSVWPFAAAATGGNGHRIDLRRVTKVPAAIR